MPKSRGSGSISSIASSGSASGGIDSSTGVVTGAETGSGIGVGNGTDNINGGAVNEFMSSGSGGAGSAEELANRLLDRITEARTITVPSYSNTRRSNEDLQVTFSPSTPGSALVDSMSGVSYVVDYANDSCTCPQHRFRGGVCRHIEATHRAAGEIFGGNPPIGPQAGETLNSSDAETAISMQAEADRVAENQRQNAQVVEEDDGFFYTENDQAFEETLNNAANTPLPYDYENALNGSQNTFGLEIEFVGGNADAIARELYSLGICAYDHRVGYHSSSVPGKWKLERDGSVSSGTGGGELVSPVLRDTPETWRNLETICEVARRHGARINDRCGGHVHIGMDPLDTARQRWKRFFKTVGGFEDVMYRLSGGTEGRIRSGHDHYATPFANRATQGATSRFQMNDINDVQSLASNISNRNRYYGINLTNIYNASRPNTVEFRYFNSSLDPRQLQANIKIANGVMMAAEKARTRVDSDSSTRSNEHMRKRGEIIKNLNPHENQRSSHNGIRKMVDVIFTRKKDKDAAISVYARNSWRN